MNDVLPPSQGSIGRGLGLTLALHALAVVLSCAFAGLTGPDAVDGLMPFIAIGVVQLVYIVPAYLVCSGESRRRTRKGLVLGAGITFLLNATCAGLVLNSL